MTDAIAVRPLTREALDTAADSLVDSFLDDPMVEWVFPDPSSRAQKLRVLQRIPLAFGLGTGLHVTQTDGGRGVAIWLGPGQTMSPVGLARYGMLAAPFKVGLGPVKRFGGANGAMAPVHKQAMAGQPHWQLLIVGVDPDLQGQGRGAALVRDGLKRADQQGLPCYLDTSKRANIGFYEHLGFVVVDEVPLGKGGPPAWGMRREPQPVPHA
jgi:ribosomal protein S18 acetylase RimI-like enzyme